MSLGPSGRGNWLTLHREYLVLEIVAMPGRGIDFRVIANNGTPILADSTLFAAPKQKLPESWVCVVTEGGIVEFGPSSWREPGYWERFFNRDPEAAETFRREVEALGG